MPAQLLVATRNEGKVRELLPMLETTGLRGMTLTTAGIAYVPEEEGIECFDTFEENALAKARWFSARSNGMLVLADDSGLAVDALGGEPGVRSKRWAEESGAIGHALDDANNAKLVRSVRGVANRSARYVCVAALAWPTGELFARGECAGQIVDSPSGAEGFGYDPYFFSEELGVTFGVASIEAKERVSHRGRAVRAVLEQFCAVEKIKR